MEVTDKSKWVKSMISIMLVINQATVANAGPTLLIREGWCKHMTLTGGLKMRRGSKHHGTKRCIWCLWLEQSWALCLRKPVLHIGYKRPSVPHPITCVVLCALSWPAGPSPGLVRGPCTGEASFDPCLHTRQSSALLRSQRALPKCSYRVRTTWYEIFDCWSPSQSASIVRAETVLGPPLIPGIQLDT